MRQCGRVGDDRIKEMVTNWTVKLFRGTAREAQPHPFFRMSDKTALETRQRKGCKNTFDLGFPPKLWNQQSRSCSLKKYSLLLQIIKKGIKGFQNRLENCQGELQEDFLKIPRPESAGISLVHLLLLHSSATHHYWCWQHKLHPCSMHMSEKPFSLL